MQSTLNWAKLNAQGRCKDIGVPFSEEERDAIHNLKIPVEYVRDGIVTLDAYTKALDIESKEGVPMERESLEKLQGIASDESIKFTSDTPKNVLVLEIKKRRLMKKQAAKQAKLLAETKEKIEKDFAKDRAKATKLEDEAKREMQTKIDNGVADVQAEYEDKSLKMSEKSRGDFQKIEDAKSKILGGLEKLAEKSK